jgi:hypothetical protein
MGKSKSRPKQSNAIWWVAGIAVVAVAGLVALSQWTNNRKVTPVTPVADVHPDSAYQGDRNRMGSASAKVQIVEYGDYL